MDFRRTTVEELAALVAGGEVTARELTEVALARIDGANPEINAFVAVDHERALAEADQVDQRLGAGEDAGPLAGVPIGVKDTEDAIGYRTTQGSTLFADGPFADADSELVARLRQAGCVIVGKTNTPELAWKGDTDNSIFGRTRNPWGRDRSAGGSSGGSSAAVAAGLVPMATGSDGGGSLRIPAALCGLSTLKCSLGRVPVGGRHPPGWADLSSKGVLTRTIRDTVLALDSVIGPEPTDLRSLPMPDHSWLDALDQVRPPRAVLWSPDLGYADVDDEIAAICRRAVDRLADAGTEIIELDSVFDADPVVDWLHLSVIANLRTLEIADPEGTRRNEVDPGLAAMLGWVEAKAPITATLAAQDLAHQLNLRLVELFHRAPLLLTPTVAGQTPFAGREGTVDGVERPDWARFTYPFNLTRSPAGSVTAGFTADGMPVGLQVIGPQHGDIVVFRLLAVLEDLLAIDTICPYEPAV
jgi:aspartyl-tRNA(Asn)/glutamyl-tRNA(Gln) amidotransferase subunit A